MQQMGLDLTSLLVENVSLPPEVEQALDKRTSMGVIGNLNAYTQFQAAEALRDAAKNPGGAGQMMGFMVGQQMAGQVGAAQTNAAAAAHTPPPIPQQAAYFCVVNGAQAGPFDIPTLAQRVARGELTRDSLVWKNGMANWSPAASVPELASLFAGPPPIPGQ